MCGYSHLRQNSVLMLLLSCIFALWHVTHAVRLTHEVIVKPTVYMNKALRYPLSISHFVRDPFTETTMTNNNRTSRLIMSVRDLNGDSLVRFDPNITPFISAQDRVMLDFGDGEVLGMMTSEITPPTEGKEDKLFILVVKTNYKLIIVDLTKDEMVKRSVSYNITCCETGIDPSITPFISTITTSGDHVVRFFISSYIQQSTRGVVTCHRDLSIHNMELSASSCSEGDIRESNEYAPNWVANTPSSNPYTFMCSKRISIDTGVIRVIICCQAVEKLTGRSYLLGCLPNPSQTSLHSVTHYYLSLATESLVIIYGDVVYIFGISTQFPSSRNWLLIFRTRVRHALFSGTPTLLGDITLDNNGINLVAMSSDGMNCVSWYLDLVTPSLQETQTEFCMERHRDFIAGYDSWNEGFSAVITIETYSNSTSKYYSSLFAGGYREFGYRERDLFFVKLSENAEETLSVRPYYHPFLPLLTDRVGDVIRIPSISSQKTPWGDLAERKINSFAVATLPGTMRRAWIMHITNKGEYFYGSEFDGSVPSGYKATGNTLFSSKSQTYLYSLMEKIDISNNEKDVLGSLITYNNESWVPVYEDRRLPLKSGQFFAFVSTTRGIVYSISKVFTSVSDNCTNGDSFDPYPCNYILEIGTTSWNKYPISNIDQNITIQRSYGFLDDEETIILLEVTKDDISMMSILDLANRKFDYFKEIDQKIIGVVRKGQTLLSYMAWENDHLYFATSPIIRGKDRTTLGVFRSLELSTKSMYTTVHGISVVSGFPNSNLNPSFLYLVGLDGDAVVNTVVFQIDIRGSSPKLIHSFTIATPSAQVVSTIEFVKSNNDYAIVFTVGPNQRVPSRITFVRVPKPYMDRTKRNIVIGVTSVLICGLFGILIFVGSIFAIIFIKLKRKYERLQEQAIQAENSAQKWIIDFFDLQIGKEIGRGAYGIVYRGKWGQSTVAIKKLFNMEEQQKDYVEIQSQKVWTKTIRKSGSNGADESLLDSHSSSKSHHQSFINEAHTLIRLRHMSVLLFLGICIHDDHRFIVTEFLERGPLEDYLKGKFELDLEQKVRILKEVAEGMAYLHKKNPSIIHRDLKPQNILLNQYMCPKIVDFGLSDITQHTNGAVGTAPYCAPEVLAGAYDDQPIHYTTSCDVYSFAMVMYHVLTESAPFGAVLWDGIPQNRVIRGERPRLPFATYQSTSMKDNMIELKEKTDIIEEQQVVFDEEMLRKWCNMRRYTNTFLVMEYVKLMASCWQDKPEKRPKFADIHDRLEFLTAE